MADIVTIELGFRQQVATEASKTFRELYFAAGVTPVAVVSDAFTVTEINLISRGSRDNSYGETQSSRSSPSAAIRCSKSQIIL